MANAPSNVVQLAESLKWFLNSDTQTPIETVCKSALYLLANVPAGRSAALEYIGHFYDIASLLNLNQLQSLRNDPNAAVDINNSNHINQIVDNISIELTNLLLDRVPNKDVWAVELVQWLITVLITIVGKYGTLIGQIAGASSPAEESGGGAGANPASLVDCLQIWSVQCKSTRSILQLVQKCYISASPAAQASIFEILLSVSYKSNLFDWLLCELGALNPKFVVRKLFELGVKESLLTTNLDSQFVLNQAPLPRVSAVNFYSLNYSAITKSVLKELLKEANEEPRMTKPFLIYLLKLASQSVALLNLLLNEILGEDLVFINYLWPHLVGEDNKLMSDLVYTCIKQLNNSIAVYDLITSILKWLHDAKRAKNEKEWSIIQKLLVTHVDDLIESVYLSCAERSDKPPRKQTSDSILLLKNLNSIGSASFKLLLDQIISYLQLADERRETTNDEFWQANRQLLTNLIVLIGINGNSYSANAIMCELLKAKPDLNEDGRLADSSLLVRFRQEINPFYANCFRETIYSLVKSFANGHSDSDDEHLKYFIENLTTVYGWDLANPNFMTENVSNILTDKTCFSHLIDQIKLHPSSKKNYSFTIMQLYNQILSSSEPDLPNLKLGIEDSLKCGVKLINHFYDLCFSMNESNHQDHLIELNELNDLVKNTCKHLAHYFGEKGPYRTVLMRTLIDRLFEFLKDPKLQIGVNLFMDEATNGSDDTAIDENSNLFTSNLNLINNEIALTKSKLKAVRNVLNEPPAKRLALKKAQVRDQNKLIMNFALLSILDTICTRSKEEHETGGGVKSERVEIDEMDTTDHGASDQIRTDLLGEQMNNLSELMLQHILLDQFYADYTWPSAASGGDTEEHNDSELEAMKIFIERDVAVHNMVENVHNRHIIWQILDFIAQDEQAFAACSPIIRSLLAFQIIQWESSQEQPSRNLPKAFEVTLKLLNLLNRPAGLLPSPLCHIVDIVPFVSTYEVYLMLLMIWRYLKLALRPGAKVPIQVMDTKQLRYIFQKNIGKLAPFYAKFFKKKSPQAKASIPTIPTASAV